MPDYAEAISQALEKTYQRMRTQVREIDIGDIRWIIFSDHHRGQGDGADDFRSCKANYHAALGYYLQSGHTLFLLGDVEELWECYPSRVIRHYADTLALERRFSESGPGRYFRLFGNHDDIWSWTDRTGRQPQVEKHLKPYIAADIVNEAFLFRVRIGKEIRDLFLVHGHQGEFINDRYRWFSRVAIRFVWRNVQRLFRIPSTTAASSFDIRGRQEKAIYKWAVAKEGMMTICGDTHHPVFAAKIHEESIREDITASESKLRRARSDSMRQAIGREIRDLHADLEWTRAKQDGPGKDWGLEGPGFKPCYFNSGACCFADGDITGIEIADGKIRLVRWPDDNSNPRPKILREADFTQLLLKC